MAPNTTDPDKQQQPGTKEQNPNWSGAYWVALVDQVLVVGLVAFLAVGLLGESYRACHAAELAVPKITQWYFSVGPSGLALGGLVSVLVSIAVIGLRRRFMAVIVTSLSFVSCIVFLGGGIFASIAPLLVAIRDMLPPESRW